MNEEFDTLLVKLRAQHSAIRNSCHRESFEAHLRTLAGEGAAANSESVVTNFPRVIHVAYASCACGVREFIVDGSTQECQTCGGLMFRQETVEYILTPGGLWCRARVVPETDLAKDIGTMTENPPTDRQVYLELLKLKSSEASSLMANILKVEALYLAITGAMLKFALDVNSTPDLRFALAWLSLALAGFLWVAALFAELYRRSLKRDFALIHVQLGIDGIGADAEPGIRLGSIGIAATNLVIVAGWIYLLFGL